MLDFEGRCAYSMQHSYRAGGIKCMEVDHFNPKIKRKPIQDYSNLFLSTRHCNGSKRDRWPDSRDLKLGLRFLNCCEEKDYGVHIFEDPDTHELVGVTPPGIYHVRNCDLNAPHLVAERSERARIWQLLSQRPILLKKGWELPHELKALRTVVESMIPLIPYLSGEKLAQHRARRIRIAAIEG